MRAVLDTSVLIGGEPVSPGTASAISVVSIAELHFGLLVATDDDTRAKRATRLGMLEARFAATANVHGAVLLTNNLKDFASIADLVDARSPDGG